MKNKFNRDHLIYLSNKHNTKASNPIQCAKDLIIKACEEGVYETTIISAMFYSQIPWVKVQTKLKEFCSKNQLDYFDGVSETIIISWE
jgi:hypothetical protein